MPVRQIRLHVNRPQVLAGAGVELRAVSGIVWITETGAAGDVFLRAGERHRSGGRGRVVVEAVRGEARLELVRAPWWPAALASVAIRIAAALKSRLRRIPAGCKPFVTANWRR